MPSLIQRKVQCGKPNCKCAAGNLHGPYWYLEWMEGTKRKWKYLGKTLTDKQGNPLTPEEYKSQILSLDSYDKTHEPPIFQSPEEIARLNTIIRYKGLTKAEAQRLLEILRMHPEKAQSEEFIFKTATQVKGTFIMVSLPHKLRDAFTDLAQKKNMTMENLIIQLMKEALNRSRIET